MKSRDTIDMGTIINPYRIITSRQDKLFLISISALYIILFFIIFNPVGFFNSFSSFDRYNRIVGFAPKWALIIAFNEFLIRPLLLKRIDWTWSRSLLWFLWEGISLGVLTLVMDIVTEPAFYKTTEAIVGWIFQSTWFFLFPLVITGLLISYRKSVLDRRQAQRKWRELEDNLETHLRIKGKNKTEFLSLSLQDLVYLEAKGNYVHIAYLGKEGELKKYLIRSTIKEIRDQLVHFNVVQIHRSFLVNSYHIDRFQRSEGRLMVQLKNNQQLPISEKFYKEILSKNGVLDRSDVKISTDQYLQVSTVIKS